MTNDEKYRRVLAEAMRMADGEKGSTLPGVLMRLEAMIPVIMDRHGPDRGALRTDAALLLVLDQVLGMTCGSGLPSAVRCDAYERLRKALVRREGAASGAGDGGA